LILQILSPFETSPKWARFRVRVISTRISAITTEH